MWYIFSNKGISSRSQYTLPLPVCLVEYSLNNTFPGCNYFNGNVSRWWAVGWWRTYISGFIFTSGKQSLNAHYCRVNKDLGRVWQLHMTVNLQTSWWRHRMETFSALLAICAPVPGEFPAQRPMTRSFDVFFDLCLDKRLSKQSWGWWFETLSHPLWRHHNGLNWDSGMDKQSHMFRDHFVYAPSQWKTTLQRRFSLAARIH